MSIRDVYFSGIGMDGAHRINSVLILSYTWPIQAGDAFCLPWTQLKTVL